MKLDTPEHHRRHAAVEALAALDDWLCDHPEVWAKDAILLALDEMKRVMGTAYADDHHPDIGMEIRQMLTHRLCRRVKCPSSFCGGPVRLV